MSLRGSRRSGIGHEQRGVAIGAAKPHEACARPRREVAHAAVGAVHVAQIARGACVDDLPRRERVRLGGAGQGRRQHYAGGGACRGRVPDAVRPVVPAPQRPVLRAQVGGCGWAGGGGVELLPWAWGLSVAAPPPTWSNHSQSSSLTVRVRGSSLLGQRRWLQSEPKYSAACRECSGCAHALVSNHSPTQRAAWRASRQRTCTSPAP